MPPVAKWLAIAALVVATLVVTVLVFTHSSNSEDKPESKPEPGSAEDKTSLIYRLNKNQFDLTQDKRLESITTTLKQVAVEGQTGSVPRDEYYQALRIVGKDYCEAFGPTISKEAQILNEPGWPEEVSEEVQDLLALDAKLLAEIKKCSAATEGTETGKILERFRKLSGKAQPLIQALNKKYLATL